MAGSRRTWSPSSAEPGGRVMRLPRTLVLHRRYDPEAQFGRGAPWKIRITQGLTRHQDEVGIALRQDRFGLVRVGDEADGAGGDTGFATDSRRERHLVTGRERDRRVRDRAARG